MAGILFGSLLVKTVTCDSSVKLTASTNIHGMIKPMAWLSTTSRVVLMWRPKMCIMDLNCNSWPICWLWSPLMVKHMADLCPLRRWFTLTWRTLKSLLMRLYLMKMRFCWLMKAMLGKTVGTSPMILSCWRILTISSCPMVLSEGLMCRLLRKKTKPFPAEICGRLSLQANLT